MKLIEKYRRARAQKILAHPGVIVWRLLWWTPLILSFGLFLLVVCIAHGPREAGRLWRENV